MRNSRGEKKKKEDEEEREKSYITFSGIIGRKFFSRFNVHWQRTRSRSRAVKVVSNIHEENISGSFDGFFRRLKRTRLAAAKTFARVERVDNFAGRRGKQANNSRLRLPPLRFLLSSSSSAVRDPHSGE